MFYNINIVNIETFLIYDDTGGRAESVTFIKAKTTQ